MISASQTRLSSFSGRVCLCVLLLVLCFSNKHFSILSTFRLLIRTFQSRQAQTGDFGSSHRPLWTVVGLLVYTQVTRVRFLVGAKVSLQPLLLRPKSIPWRSVYAPAQEDIHSTSVHRREPETWHYSPPGAPPTVTTVGTAQLPRTTRVNVRDTRAGKPQVSEKHRRTIPFHLYSTPKQTHQSP